MRRLLPFMAGGLSALALAAPPVPGTDYRSVQIASGSPAGLEKLFARYADLPYLRIERRGDQHVLRAGFWSDSRSAREALAGSGHVDLMMRTAMFRPETILRRNWEESAGSTAKDPGPETAVLAAQRPAEKLPPAAETQPAPAMRPPEGEGSGAMRPYDAEDFRLAFDAFVGVGDLVNALRVAQHAVKNDPGNLDWRRKLARVAEWTGRPETAWEQRDHLYRHGQRDQETVEALLRLGVLFGSPEMLLGLWLGEAQRRSLTPAQWNELHRLYETVGRPADGARYFEQQFRRRGEVQFLTWAAEHAEHAGRDEDALRLYLERATLEPFSTAAVLSASTFLIRRDRLGEAHRVLEQYSHRVPDSERDYWEKLGAVAWELLDSESAERAYRRYLEQNPVDDSGLWSRLIYLVQQKSPREAAALAMSLYQRQGGVDQVMLALNLLAGASDQAEQVRVFAALRPQDLPALETDPRFLLIRAGFHQRQRLHEPAWRDLQQALVLSPDDADVAIAALWFMIDRRETGTLTSFLSRWQAHAEETPAFWLPFAAAYHGLDRYQEALPWYRKEIARQPQDTLLLLNYADLIDRLQMPGMSLRIRRHAWHQLRERNPGDLAQLAKTGNAELLALARLMLLDRPGDGAMRLAQQVVNQLRQLPEDSLPDDQAKDLVLAWAIGSEQFPNARSWMWQNHVRQQKAPPVWGESQTALQLNDTETMQRLIDTRFAAMPIYNRYDVSYTLEHWQQALDIAFHGMEDSPVDNDLHDRYRIHAPLHSDYVQFGWRGDRLGDYDARQIDSEVHLKVSQRLALTLSMSGISQSSKENQLDSLMPGRDRLLGVEAHWQGTRGNTRVALFQRAELERFVGWRISQDWRWSTRVGLDGALDYRADATESLPLRVGGSQSGLRLGINYTLSKREAMRIGLRQTRFATQFGDDLGTGRFVDLDFTHRLRTEYPDWRLRAYASFARYSYGSGIGARALNAVGPEIRDAVAAGTLDPVRYFLPEDSRTVGLCFGMGENLAGQNIRSVYSRAWRHYYELCSTRNDVAGSGYSVDFGLVGSLTGEDHVLLGFGQSVGGAGNQGVNRQLQFRYRHYF